MRPFRGLVLGWYHQRNAGDDRLAFCIERWLHDHELTFGTHTQTPPRELLERCDYVVLGGGSLANAHHGAFRNMRDWIEAARLPVWGVGLTISSIPALRDELRALGASGGRIWVRDQESADFLGYSRDECVAAPDLSWLFPLGGARFGLPPDAPRKGIAVNFRPWPKRNWSAGAWREPIARLEGATPYPLCFGRDDDRATLREVWGENALEHHALRPDAEFDPTLAARSELVIAMRFHAILFAIQSQTPFVALGNSRKLQWMLDGLGLSDCVVPIEEPQRLGEGIARAQALDGAQLGRITREQHEHAWDVAREFKAQIEARAAQARTRRERREHQLGPRLKRRLKL